MCEQALPPFKEFDLTDADNVFYIEAKKLLINGYRNQFNMFISWASGTTFDLADTITDNYLEWVPAMTYGVDEDDARTIATTILYDYSDRIMSRLESGVITSKMEY